MIVRRRRVDRWTTIPNEVLRDHRLSWKARGLLCHLLSMPDGWRTSSDRLARLGPDGRDAVRSGLAELETAGYLIRRRCQDRRTGRWSTEVIVLDDPIRDGELPAWLRDPGDNAVDNVGRTITPDAGISDVGYPGVIRNTPTNYLFPKDIGDHR